MSEHSFLVSKTLTFTYPFLILFGIYIVLNGHISPGGGFQGGAILATVIIIKYLIEPNNETRLVGIRLIEKIALLFIFVLAMSFLLTTAHLKLENFSVLYLILMNILISIKVACGMTIIFIRFEFYETR